MSLVIRWKKLHPKAVLPSYGSVEAACFDFRAALDAPLTIEPGQIVAVPTGLAVEIPQGFELQVRARSGLALKHGLTLVNGVGTVDSDYRGEIKVIVTILGKDSLTFQNGDRIAQGLVSSVIFVEHKEVGELSNTDRGVGGFGSTGMH